jgi:hypothetical protein
MEDKTGAQNDLTGLANAAYVGKVAVNFKKTKFMTVQPTQRVGATTEEDMETIEAEYFCPQCAQPDLSEEANK